MHESIETYIQTDNLTAIIYKDSDMKLEIYNKYKSPYGWSPRKLLVSHYGVQAKAFTYREYATSGAGLCFLALGGLIQVLSHGTFVMQQILLAMW